MHMPTVNSKGLVWYVLISNQLLADTHMRGLRGLLNVPLQNRNLPILSFCFYKIKNCSLAPYLYASGFFLNSEKNILNSNLVGNEKAHFRHALACRKDNHSNNNLSGYCSTI